MAAREPTAATTPDIGAAALAELALDLHWSWDHSTDDLWQAMDPDLWGLTHNPWVVLQTVSRTRLHDLLAQPEFRNQVERLQGRTREHLSARGWFQHRHPEAPLHRVAYFSMEFGLSEALPIYSGGLGNVAGDQLKAASDLGVPVAGIGLLYQQGYFRQVIAADGTQEELYPYNDPGQLPITPVRDASGELLRVEFHLPGYKFWLRAWQVQVGRLTLYLLDSNDPANPPAIRGVTSELYGGGPEQRLRQEMVLGIGGWRLLRALRLEPEVCHLNEGHAALAVLERARDFMEDSGQPFDVALAVTRAGNLFTTHTPVAAGFDRFAPALVERYLRRYAEETIGIGVPELLALGRESSGDASEPFNMAYLAVRGSIAVNGVSRLHGAVSRRIFQSLFPRWPEVEVPVRHVTNGVHTPTWDSPEADALWTTACGSERWRGTLDTVERDIRGASDSELWAMRRTARQHLVDYARERVAQKLASMDAPSTQVEAMRGCLDPEALTLVFARRFATYKRPTLLLQDPERLVRILSDRDRPVQLIIAGKAHPADEPGQAMIREWFRFVRRSEVQQRAIFLPDYDLLLAEHLVQGADLWINTPRRPWEASGTSGMKVLVNGGLNLSELDGWWAEAYTPEVGWAIGRGEDYSDKDYQNQVESNALYTLLETEIVPLFYSRSRDGLPRGWIRMMKQSMRSLCHLFNTDRMVKEYVRNFYLPALAENAHLLEGDLRNARDMAAWKSRLYAGWGGLEILATEAEISGSEKVGSTVPVTARIRLGNLTPDDVTVEAYYGQLDEARRIKNGRAVEMRPDTDNPDGVHVYRAHVPCEESGSRGLALRIVPSRAKTPNPLGFGLVKWM